MSLRDLILSRLSVAGALLRSTPTRPARLSRGMRSQVAAIVVRKVRTAVSMNGWEKEKMARPTTNV